MIAPFDRSRGLEGTSSIQPESGSIVLAQIGRLPKEVKGLVEQLRWTRALPTSGSQDCSHDVEIDAGAGVDEFPQFPSILLTGQRVRSVEQGSHFGHELSLCCKQPGPIDLLGVVHQNFDRNLQPSTELGLINRIHINPDPLDLELEFPAADVLAR